MQAVKIVVVGTGHVGAATAFALVLRGLGDEIILIDSDFEKAEGEAVDLAQASLVGSHPGVYVGDYEDCQDASIVIITAGHAQQPTETEQMLLEANAKVLKEVAPKIGSAAPRALLIIAAHPNEVLTAAAAKLSGLPSHRVIGVGTSLDTACFKHEIAKHYQVDACDVHASIVGIHGINEFALWSQVTIDGILLESYLERAGMGQETEELEACFWKATRTTFEIIERKGSPSMSMAAGICAIVEALQSDNHSMLTVAANGTYFGIKDIALSVPTKLSRAGAQHMLAWSGDSAEEDKIRVAAEQVNDGIRSAGFQKLDQPPNRLEKDQSEEAAKARANEARARVEIAAEYQ